MLIRYLFSLCFLFLLIRSANAEEDSTGLRICSQNLARFGEVRKKGESKRVQKRFLVSRMQDAECDIIALQEIYGENLTEAKRNIKDLAQSLGTSSGRKFAYYLGETIDPYIRNGFLVAEDKGAVLGVKNYLDEPLERLQPLGQVGRFLRAPIALLYKTRSPDKTFFILNIHFKSKAFGFKDPTGNSFEAWRMEMAEGTRKIFKREINNQGAETVFVLLGDRNADFKGASAEILSGKHLLSDFTSKGCSLNKELEAVCPQEINHQEEFVPLFAKRREDYPRQYESGSYLYKKKLELIDEIYILPQSLGLLKRENNTYRLGMEGEFLRGSDHKLIWAEFQ